MAGRTKTDLRDTLLKLSKSADVLNIEGIFEEIRAPEDVRTARAKVDEGYDGIKYLLDLLHTGIIELNRVEQATASSKLKEGIERKGLGYRIWRASKQMIGIIDMPEVILLLEVAYARAQKHFDNAGKYLPEHQGKDEHLVRLPIQYARFRKNIDIATPEIPKEAIPEDISRVEEQKEKLQDALQGRLEAFLVYLRTEDTEFDILNIRKAYEDFERVMDFCHSIPATAIHLPFLKETVHNSKWSTFKRRTKDKQSEQYQWISKMQKFEKETGRNLNNIIQKVCEPYKSAFNTPLIIEYKNN